MAQVTTIELKEVTASAVGGTFENFGAAISNPVVHAVFINTSANSCYIAIDGATDYIRVLPQGVPLVLPSYERHNTLLQGSYIFKAGTQLSIRFPVAQASGSVVAHLLTVT